MVAQYFAQVDTWVFDLDNTLYPPSADLFGLMDERFANYVKRLTGLERAEALALCRQYWHEHGSTLRGLMDQHDVDPHEFLADVHDIDISHLSPDLALNDSLAKLAGSRIVYTNGSRNHAERVLKARGLNRLFDAIFSIEDAEFTAKPQRAAFDTVFAKAGITPRSAAMFEDEERNLVVPHALGVRTVHVHPTPTQADHIHHHTDDLADFLSHLSR